MNGGVYWAGGDQLSQLGHRFADTTLLVGILRNGVIALRQVVHDFQGVSHLLVVIGSLGDLPTHGGHGGQRAVGICLLARPAPGIAARHGSETLSAAAIACFYVDGNIE